MSEHLDNPVWHSLVGAHADYAIIDTLAARFWRGVNPIGAVSEDSEAAWLALAGLTENDEVLYTGIIGGTKIPDCWAVERDVPMLQMILNKPPPAIEEPVRWTELADGDITEAKALAEMTKPGPFDDGTMRLGRFIGYFERSQLVAMAGERFCLPGHREISAVCTHPDWQGRGLARKLMTEIIAGIQGRGETAFLHVLTENTGAVRLYETLGFETRVEMRMKVLRKVR